MANEATPTSDPRNHLLRYVVLYHHGIDEPHFDLMWERAPGEPLHTFRCPHWPPEPGDEFTELPNHRSDYLEYQGPVSRNRGHVKRVALGRCTCVVHADHYTLVLDCGIELSLHRDLG